MAPGTIALAVAVAVAMLVTSSPGLRRFCSGAPMDGKLRTNATFLQPPTKALHPTADKSRWHWRPGWHRAAARAGGAALAISAA